MAVPPDLRPRTVGEILDASFHLYRHRFGALLLACTVLSIPTLVGAVLLSPGAAEAFGGYFGAALRYFEASGSSGGRFTPEMKKSLEGVLEKAGDVQVYALLSTLLQSVSRGGACVAGAIVAAAAVRREPVPGAWELVRRSVHRLGPATAVQFVLALVGAFCSLCLPIPVLCAAVLAPACAALTLEIGPRERAARAGRITPLRWLAVPIASTFDCIARSFELSFHGMTLVRATSVVSLVLLFVSAIVTALTLAGGLAAMSIGVGFVLNHYAEVIFLPVVGVSFALWYLDLRVRREGVDLTEEA